MEMQLKARQFLICLVILFIIGGLYANNTRLNRELYNRVLLAFI